MTTEQWVQFGITTPQHHVTYEELRRVWQAADELGYDSAWLFDHFFPIAGDVEGPCLEAMVTLTALAVQTQRLRVGTLVLGNTYRNPAVLANMAAALDIVSQGRLDLGLGAGWYGLEHKSYGIPFPPTADRIGMVGEALQVMKLMWTESKVNFRGRYYTLSDALCQPKPVQKPHPPLWVGGAGERLTLRMVAEHADGWNYMAPPQEYSRKLQVLAHHSESVGRDIDSIRKSIHFVLGIDRAPLRAQAKAQDAYVRFGVPAEEAQHSAIIGTPEECIERLRQYTPLGVGHFIIELRPPYDYEGLELFAEKVIPAFR